MRLRLETDARAMSTSASDVSANICLARSMRLQNIVMRSDTGCRAKLPGKVHAAQTGRGRKIRKRNGLAILASMSFCTRISCHLDKTASSMGLSALPFIDEDK